MQAFSKMYQLRKQMFKPFVRLETCLFTAPSFIQSIQHMTTEEGENVIVSCNASGTSPLMVSWIKVGGDERFDGIELVLTNINRSEAGEYRCEASNECGNASETATIEVQCKYQFLVLNCLQIKDGQHAGKVMSSSMGLVEF